MATPDARAGTSDEGTAPEPRGRYTIDAVDNAARILLMLVERPWLRTSDVANELGVARSTAHRMVTTLLQRGLLRYNPGDTSYGPGYRLVELGMSVIGVGDLKGEAAPFLARVAADTGETAHLVLLEGTEIVFVSVVEGGHVIRAASRVGARVPAHATAAGKCLLAHLTPEEVSERYGSTRLTAETDATLRSRAALTGAIDRARADGYAINDGESEAELGAISAPVVDTRGTAHGAISISGPRERITANRARYLEAVRGAAHGLEAKLFGRAAE